MTFKKLDLLNGRTTLAGLFVDHSWTVAIKKNWILISRYFLLKKFDQFFVN